MDTRRLLFFHSGVWFESTGSLTCTHRAYATRITRSQRDLPPSRQTLVCQNMADYLKWRMSKNSVSSWPNEESCLGGEKRWAGPSPCNRLYFYETLPRSRTLLINIAGCKVPKLLGWRHRRRRLVNSTWSKIMLHQEEKRTQISITVSPFSSVLFISPRSAFILFLPPNFEAGNQL